MTLPAGHARHLVDRCALGLTQHGNHHVLLGGALRVGSRLGIRQPFDRRPQLIDQALAVADLPPLIDTGQRVPQCQKPFATERGGCSSSFEATTISPSLSDFRELYAAQPLHAGLIILIPVVNRVVQQRLCKAALDELAVIGEPVNRVLEVDLDGEEVTLTLYDLPPA
jgi:hypothetical protein